MDYIQIATYIAMVVLGFVSVYLQTKTNVVSKCAELIEKAEIEYYNVSKSGNLKMSWCIQQINKIVPKGLKFILTDEILEEIIQSTFNYIKAYADMQGEKLAKKINEKIE